MALPSLSTLLDDFGDAVWRADALASATGSAGVVASGHAALDAQLPGGGWPLGALCEILQASSGQSEWRLLLPALRSLCAPTPSWQVSATHPAPTYRAAPIVLPHVVLVGPPYAPFGPGLLAQGLDVQTLLWVKADTEAERLWAAEQSLRCAGVAALLVWLPKVRPEHLRRLHIAAHEHAKLLFVMRPPSAQHASSPAPLRLLVTPVQADEDALAVQVFKRRGPPLEQTLLLPARPAQLAVLLAVSRPGSELRTHPHALDRVTAAA